MAYLNPSVADFKSFFVRDFPYGTDMEDSVLDSDIAKSFQFTNMAIFQGNFSNQSNYTTAYLLLSAHYLVLNLRSSTQGINGQFSFLEQSKGVGQVNQAFAIPQQVLDNPLWSIYMKTNYGAQYLEIILKQSIGVMTTVIGRTRP